MNLPKVCPLFGNIWVNVIKYDKQKTPAPKNTEPQNRPNTAKKSPGESTPVLFYIITPKIERQYLTVDSSIRQDKSG